MATVHNDEDGTLRVLDDERLEESVVLARINGAGTGHNNAVVLEETVLLSLASEGRVTAYNLLDGRAGQTFDGCPGTHGWTTPSRTFAAAGCTDGVLLFTKSGAQMTARKVGEPTDSPEAARVSTLASHPASPVLIGNFGQGLAIVRPDATEVQPVPLSTAPVRFAFNQAGTRIIALTLDGRLQALDPESGETLWSIDVVTPVDTATAGAPRPSLAVGNEVAYITDPPTGRIVKVDLGTGRQFGTPLAIGGIPTGLALVELDGAEH
jgi:outer membrane protein assembly factor BamB